MTKASSPNYLLVKVHMHRGDDYVSFSHFYCIVSHVYYIVTLTYLVVILVFFNVISILILAYFVVFLVFFYVIPILIRGCIVVSFFLTVQVIWETQFWLIYKHFAWVIHEFVSYALFAHLVIHTQVFHLTIPWVLRILAMVANPC